MLVALAAVVGGQAQPLIGEYKIGVLEPLTGPLAFEGNRHLEGYEIVRDMIDERGGVMDKRLVLAVGDATDPTAAASEANRLITREGVRIITCTYSSTLCGDSSYGQGFTEAARQRAKGEFGMQEVAAEYYAFTTISDNDFTY